MKEVLNWLVARLGEQSTWRGLIGLVTAAGVAITPEQTAAIVAVGMAAIGLVNVFRSENK